MFSGHGNDKDRPGMRMEWNESRVRLTVQSDDRNDEADGENENDERVDLEAGGFVGVESCKQKGMDQCVSSWKVVALCAASLSQ